MMARPNLYDPKDELEIHLKSRDHTRTGGGSGVRTPHTGWSGNHTALRIPREPTMYSQNSIVIVELVKKGAMKSGARTTLPEHSWYLQEEQDKNKGRGEVREKEEGQEQTRAEVFNATEDRVRTHRDIMMERERMPEDMRFGRQRLLDEASRTPEVKWNGERHHFRIIVSPQNGHKMDMRQHMRDLVYEMEKDQGTKLQWYGVIHRDTDRVHGQIVVRGKRDDGRTLYMDRQYISQGIRYRSQELATRELGLRMRDSEMVKQERALDRDRADKLREAARQPSKWKDRDIDQSMGF